MSFLQRGQLGVVRPVVIEPVAAPPLYGSEVGRGKQRQRLQLLKPLAKHSNLCWQFLVSVQVKVAASQGQHPGAFCQKGGVDHLALTMANLAPM
ncbi:MAG: hypothetical protein GY820_00600 [Gammaproteobacteria bacterium]|nr:hypothetical protein [Gammaproteobacteria bacterium]